MQPEEYDVVIIGAGVTGAAIARQLGLLDLKTAVLEKNEDVCTETSKANSGIVHGGFDAKPGTMKARMNARGTALMPQLCADLDIPYINNGSLVLCFDEEHRPGLEKLYKQGQENGVPDLEIIDAQKLHELEPHLSDKAIAALYAPNAGIVDPFLLTVGLAENAADNGVNFYLNTPVESLEKTDEGWNVRTPDKTFKTKLVINAAGVHADRIHNAICPDDPKTIIPRRGSYVLLDRSAQPRVSHTIFQLPTPKGKGVLITPTCHGNILVGPTAVDVEDPENTATTAQELEIVMAKARESMPDLPLRQVITSFAGLRAHEKDGEFVLSESAPGFIDALGIESPGLSSAPAIGEYIAAMVKDLLHAKEKDNPIRTRKGVVRMDELSLDERNALIKERPSYGQIICRCEMVTTGQIEDCLHRSIPVTTLDGVKRRVRAGMGRCQSGFCMPRVMEILARENGEEMDHVCKSGPDSTIITGHLKEDLQ